MQAAPERTVLYDYWRSSACYRVRIALHLGRVDFDTVPVDLRTGEQRAPAHLAKNPQGFVPVLDIDGHRFTQSLAIIDYLDVTRQLRLWPADPVQRARVNGVVGSIAIDLHPVCNLSVAQCARGDDPNAQTAWMQHFIRKGLQATEALLNRMPNAPFAAGERPGIFEICLVPQLYNARRWGIDYSDLKRLNALSEACADISAFKAAAPAKP